jgi:hypothetical protein
VSRTASARRNAGTCADCSSATAAQKSCGYILSCMAESSGVRWHRSGVTEQRIGVTVQRGRVAWAFTGRCRCVEHAGNVAAAGEWRKAHLCWLTALEDVAEGDEVLREEVKGRGAWACVTLKQSGEQRMADARR